ncbi:MAG: magnesium protoporphyrin IX methyltransferase [Paracoccaceae bacterium]
MSLVRVAQSTRGSDAYDLTRDRVETYFDKTATKTWEALTSDAPVSKIRQTVRAGRDDMRALMLSRLPLDLTGLRVLDAGCGAGQMTEQLALKGADVVAIDISPSLVDVARKRLPDALQERVTFLSGDMLSEDLGAFDHVIAMDSLIYYSADDIVASLSGLMSRVSGSAVFTVAPRTPLLMAMWYAGKLFPKQDRSPVMIPHNEKTLNRATNSASAAYSIRSVGRVSCGFYISEAMEVRA